MLRGLLLATVLLLVPQHSGRQGTLGDELARHDVPALGVADVWREITSYAVFDESDWFGIAYYWYENSDRLPNLLRVRVYDRRTGKWTAAELDGPWGSILRMKRSDRWWYVTGHYNPSAVPTLVLSRDLKMVAELKGAPALILADGRVVYHNNVVHFAPAHPGSLSLYDPTSGLNARLFPSEDDKVTDGIMTDRTVGEVKLIGRNTVAFETSEHQVTILRAGGASGPETRFHVTCDLAALSCRSRPIPIVPEPQMQLEPGLYFFQNYLKVEEQAELWMLCRALADGPVPMYTPTVRGGKKMSVGMLCLGRHWNGLTYRYEPTRSDFDGLAVPPLPQEFERLASAAAARAGFSLRPDLCIMSYYNQESRMGVHQDKDESRESLEAGVPIVSVSLGDTARFVVGGLTRREPTQPLMLRSGDVVVMGGASRLRFHGVTRILAGTAPAGLGPGRFNLTFRQA